ncbi:HAD family phosphatase [Iamia sp. SCSIO 61187]|uniref:Cof-type HAD-IIB family hydrolase n=1 Tax=Iamia sp. SCSIO 61187 TaxID=2722752 RepID=UPI001C62F360|nr:Cof-type HAD-IIB family hydrolase [Iamia sp. SCSIO 61187]QYG91702.1 HAD family phosphatase [Iamia sp. SCSIO 61187]
MTLDVQLVASDLDGTLLQPPVRRRDGQRADRVDLGSITERTRTVLDRLRADGVEVVAVTGRPPRWVHAIDIGPGLAICSNGALVVDLQTEEVVVERALAPDAAAEVVRRLRALHPEGHFAVEFADGVAIEPAWAETIPRALAGEHVGPAEELVVRPAAKVLMKVPGTEGDAFIDGATEAVGDIAEVTASGGLQLVEVSAPGVDKATTLALLCDERGIPPERVVAFGDARNDLAMLAWAGTGVAMGDAHPSVIEAADHVTGTNADDGVAAWLEQNVL